jgi:hypothetical protein
VGEERRGEERSPFSRAVHDARPATNLKGQDKLCIWPGQKPQQVSKSWQDLNFFWSGKKKTETASSFLFEILALYYYEGEVLHFLNPKILFPDIQRIFVKKMALIRHILKFIN